MTRLPPDTVARTRAAALDVLLHNRRGPFHALPRTAAWGYPEPYTRDLMIAGLGVLATAEPQLMMSLRRVLETLACNQTAHGHIPSLAHDRGDRGASDSTPLFLVVLGLYRRVTGEPDFLAGVAERALAWMHCQSPSDRILVAQMPTSDWRDEQWVLGFGLYVNVLVYVFLRLFGQGERAAELKALMDHFTIRAEDVHRHVHEGLVLKAKPYYAMWSYKSYSSERFDLLGNSLAILAGLASRTRARAIVAWVEGESAAMRDRGELATELPPNFFPFIRPGDPDWRPRYERFNRPGEYHNGGIWPFVCGFYVVAALAAGRPRIAARRFDALTALVAQGRNDELAFGFNEWHRAADGRPAGQDWQTWSAAMYLYAAACMEHGRVLFFDDLDPAAG